MFSGLKNCSECLNFRAKDAEIQGNLDLNFAILSQNIKEKFLDSTLYPKNVFFLKIQLFRVQKHVQNI